MGYGSGKPATLDDESTLPLLSNDADSTSEHPIQSSDSNYRSEVPSESLSQTTKLSNEYWTDERLLPIPTRAAYDKLYSSTGIDKTIKRSSDLRTLCTSIRDLLASSTSLTAGSSIDYQNFNDIYANSCLYGLYKDSIKASGWELKKQLGYAQREQERAYGQSITIRKDMADRDFQHVFNLHVLESVCSTVLDERYKKSKVWTVGNEELRKELDKSLISGELGVEFDKDSITATLITYDIFDDARSKNRRETKLIFNKDQSIDMICGNRTGKV